MINSIFFFFSTESIVEIYRCKTCCAQRVEDVRPPELEVKLSRMLLRLCVFSIVGKNNELLSDRTSIVVLFAKRIFESIRPAGDERGQYEDRLRIVSLGPRRLGTRAARLLEFSRREGNRWEGGGGGRGGSGRVPQGELVC